MRSSSDLLRLVGSGKVKKVKRAKNDMEGGVMYAGALTGGAMTGGAMTGGILTGGALEKMYGSAKTNAELAGMFSGAAMLHGGSNKQDADFARGFNMVVGGYMTGGVRGKEYPGGGGGGGEGPKDERDPYDVTERMATQDELDKLIKRMEQLGTEAEKEVRGSPVAKSAARERKMTKSEREAQARRADTRKRNLRMLKELKKIGLSVPAKAHSPGKAPERVKREMAKGELSGRIVGNERPPLEEMGKQTTPKVFAIRNNRDMLNQLKRFVEEPKFKEQERLAEAMVEGKRPRSPARSLAVSGVTEDLAVSAPGPDLSKMTIPQLKEVARSMGIRGYSRLKKAELITTILRRR